MNKKQLTAIWMISSFLVMSLTMPSYATEYKAEDEIVQDIREKCTVIDRVKSYRKVERDVVGKSTEGGVIVGHFQDNKLRKIAATFYFESGKTIDGYYFWEDNLIFIFERKFYYSLPISFMSKEGGGKVSKIEENHYYFNNNNLIRWLDKNGKIVSKDNSEYKAKEALLISDTKEFAERLGPFPQNTGSSYEYSQDNIPDVCFFPIDKARWDGSKITAKEWKMLTDFQKTMFISEYIEELEKGYKTSIDINGWDYLIALNGFADACKDECLNELMTRVIKELLIEQGEIKENE